MTDRVFLDTNLWVYYYAATPQAKFLKIQTLIAENFQSLGISTQVLGELYNVLVKKNMIPIDYEDEHNTQAVSLGL
jgi:predicted nucleic acid-binding protein